MGSGPVKPRSSRLGAVVIGAVVIVVVVAAVGGLAVWRAIRGDLPSEAEKAAQIERLKATVLPVIEDLQVEYFIRQSGGTIVNRYEDLAPCLLSLHPGPS